MNRMLRVALAGVLLSSSIAGVAEAQAGAGAPPRRQRMEQQLRQGLWRIAKQRIGLTDDQMTRLEESTRRFEPRRRELALDERTQRQTLRTEIAAGDRANQERVGAALDRLLQLHRQRLDLMAEEQKDISAFMTPVQRAKFAALQEQLRRRVEVMRRNRAAPDGQD